MQNILKFSTGMLHADHSHGGIGEALREHLGDFGAFLDEVIWHALLDTLKVIPFLFLTYLLMEFIEHKAADKTLAVMQRSGKVGPLLGGAIGLAPQCGFSSVASNLYSGKIITLGTIIAVFLSTSDEMLPLLVGSGIHAKTILFILLYKVFVAVAVGFGIDITLRLLGKTNGKIEIEDICDEDGCHCENGILRSSLHHTLHISLFILIFTFIINTAVFFIGEENLGQIMYDKPFVSHLIAALLGLIPNCAASVAITGFYTSGYITLGTMLSGLFSGAGIGLLVLFRVNKNIKQNLLILAILAATGTIFGMLADVTGLAYAFS